MPALVRMMGRVKTPSDRLTVLVLLDTTEIHVKMVRKSIIGYFDEVQVEDVCIKLYQIVRCGSLFLPNWENW